ncbi:MAG TPA: amidase [Pyrinomonadaceae bacterium]|nr:amidase [Pyrinomonadaceae bacterium]
MTELTSQSLAKLAELIRTRAVSPVEVLEAHLRRIDEVNPGLNAIVTLAPDAMEEAKEAEAALMRGESTGPLHGVPLTIKDTIETKGLRSTSGSLLRADFIPPADAPAVARLKAAGAIILGKTNAAEMAMDYTADNRVFGRTNNPHDSERTPGGSSGGEAAAIATCMTAGGLGSDLAGSIRIPSHFCGIAGLKPTVGVVPGEGQFPTARGPYALGSAIGPMGRNVEDLRQLLGALSRNPVRTNKAMGALRVAWYTDDGVSPVTDQTRKAVEQAAQALSDAGLVTENILPPGIERGHEMWLKLFSRASVVQLRNVYAGNEDKAGDFVRWRLATADDTLSQTIDDYIDSWLQRDQLRELLLEWMEDRPLLVAPVGATPALKHDAHKVTVGDETFSSFRAFSYSQAFNVFDLPVVVVPAGRSDEGLPIGVQIVGRPFAEATVLDAAAIVEAALGGWRMPTLTP